MLQIGQFNTLVVDERLQRVRFGPAPDGQWIDIGGWGDDEWDVLVAIVSHPSGACENDPVRNARSRARVDRKTVFRIRRRLRSNEDMPAALAQTLIVTKRGTSTYILNPTISVRVIPGRILGAGEHNEPRALDSVVHSLKRAGLELFGGSGYQKAIELLPDDVRRDTFEMSYEPGRWFPVRYISSWVRAMRDGPATSREDFKEFLRTMERYRLSPYYDQYFRSSRVNRLADIQRLWQTCYDSGTVEALVSDRSDWFEIRIWNHPYIRNESARWTHGFCWLSLAESLGAREAELQAAELEPLTGALRIRIAGVLPA